MCRSPGWIGEHVQHVTALGRAVIGWHKGLVGLPERLPPFLGSTGVVPVRLPVPGVGPLGDIDPLHLLGHDLVLSPWLCNACPRPGHEKTPRRVGHEGLPRRVPTRLGKEGNALHKRQGSAPGDGPSPGFASPMSLRRQIRPNFYPRVMRFRCDRHRLRLASGPCAASPMTNCVCVRCAGNFRQFEAAVPKRS